MPMKEGPWIINTKTETKYLLRTKRSELEIKWSTQMKLNPAKASLVEIYISIDIYSL